MKTDLFQSYGHCWVFQICWHIECSTWTVLSFGIWNSSAGIPSPPLALFIVMLSKAHCTSHFRTSSSRWVNTPSWLSWSWTSFCTVLGPANSRWRYWQIQFLVKVSSPFNRILIWWVERVCAPVSLTSYKCCTQYVSKSAKLSSGHRTGKGQFSFQSQRKAMPKNVHTTTQLHSSHMLAK